MEQDERELVAMGTWEDDGGPAEAPEDVEVEEEEVR